MSKGVTHHLSRRDFIKTVTAMVGGFITTLVGLPVIGYLLAPAMRKEENSDVIDLGPLEKYPIGIPTPFGITHTQINGWERTTTLIGMYVLRKDDGGVRVFSKSMALLSVDHLLVCLMSSGQKSKRGTYT